MRPGKALVGRSLQSCTLQQEARLVTDEGLLRGRLIVATEPRDRYVGALLMARDSTTELP